jgi:hypothetical protein
MSDPIDDVFDEIPDRFIIARESIDTNLLKEFYSCLSKMGNTKSDDEIKKDTLKLFDSKLSIDIKKDILSELAGLGTVWAYRQIEKYLERADVDIREWVKIALYECQRRVESDLVEEESGILSTGLGGENNCIRYVFIVKSEYNLMNYAEIIKKKWIDVAQANNSSIEEIEIEINYGKILCLVPINIAIGNIIDEGIEKINEIKENLLYPGYMVLNTRIPTNEEILKFVNGEML